MNPHAVEAAQGTRRLGFESLDEEVTVDRLQRRGELPEWLDGPSFGSPRRCSTSAVGPCATGSMASRC